jgi:hypothetical protein
MCTERGLCESWNADATTEQGDENAASAWVSRSGVEKRLGTE